MGSEFKRVPVLDLPNAANPSIETLRGLRPMTAQPWTNVMRAQDTVLGGARRVLVTTGLRGQSDPGTPGGAASGPGAQTHPDLGSWTTIGGHRGRLTPGSHLALRVLYYPSGDTQELDGSNYVPTGTGGRLRARVWWAKGSESSGPHEWAVNLEGQQAEPGGAGGIVIGIKRKTVGLMWPPELNGSLAEQAKYSEWADVVIELAVAGGVRIVDLAISERPTAHVQEHDEDGPQSAHAYWVGNAPPLVAQTQRPQTKGTDGAFEERRFGSHKMLEAAAQQGERLGPRILSVSTWHPLDHDWTAPHHPGITVDGSNLVHDLFAPSITAWDPDAPGFLCDGVNAQLHRHNDPALIMREGRAVIPVRVTVTAQMITRGSTGTGDVAIVRVQSSGLEWVDVPLDVENEDPQTVEAIGYLECQVVGEQLVVGHTQILTIRDFDELEFTVSAVDVDFGHWPRSTP